jgi:hypothetical protein
MRPILVGMLRKSLTAQIGGLHVALAYCITFQTSPNYANSRAPLSRAWMRCLGSSNTLPSTYSCERIKAACDGHLGLESYIVSVRASCENQASTFPTPKEKGDVPPPSRGLLLRGGFPPLI